MQRQSPIVLTGLSAQDCAPFGSACSKTGNTWMHRPAAAVLASPDLGLEAAEPWVFWLYRGPWQLQVGAPAAEEWLGLHRQLLRRRADFGTRLVLINVDADPPLAVLASLGLTHEVAEVLEPAVATADDVGMSALLAQIFDWAAPEFWDVFEALEVASPATGRLPVFRSALQMPFAEQVPLLHSLVAAGAQAPALQAELSVVHQALVQAEAERDALRAQLSQQADELNHGAVALAEQTDAAKEALGELARLEPELAQAQARGQQLAAEMKSRDVALEQSQAAQQQLVQDLRGTVADLAAAQTLADHGRTKLAELESENDRLLLQMHQVQEELEQLFLNRQQQTADADKAQAAQAAQVASLRAEIKQEAGKLAAGVTELAKEGQAGQALQGELGRLKPELAAAQAQGQKLAAELKSRDESLKQAQAAAAKAQDLTARVESLKQAQEQLTQELQAKTSDLAAAQHLAAQFKAKAAELEGENDLLLLQTHQVQEELEHYYLESRQLQKVMGQSSQSLDRARRLISRLMLSERETSPPVLTKAMAKAGTGPAAPFVEATKAA